MTSRTSTIEVDEAIAAALKERAEERGVTVADLLASYLQDDCASADVNPHDVAELDRRWAAVEAGQATVKQAQVVRWLETWGTPTFRPWRDK